MMEPSQSAIDSCPEEILLNIFEYLDCKPPSEAKARQEPDLSFATNTTHVLKDISLVSSRWRRIVLPLLFKYSCLRLDGTPKDEWRDCPVCGVGASRYEIEHPRINMPRNALEHHASLFYEESWPDETLDTTSALRKCTVGWARRFHHSIQDYLDFIDARGLNSKVYGFALLTGPMVPDTLVPSAELSRLHLLDLRFPAASILWHHLLTRITPGRIVIVAPPMDLACLTNSSLDLTRDWTVVDMDFHMLELRQSGQERSAESPIIPERFRRGDCYPTKPSGIASGSILYLRPWTHLGLNEGSYLKAYGSYNYFERGLPVVIGSIKRNLDRALANPSIWPTLRSLTYTSILPFAPHFQFTQFLSRLEELDVQIAPEPGSHILDNRARVGTAELSDCWSQFFHGYRGAVEPFCTFNRPWRNAPRLKKFVCRDVNLPLVRNDLDDLFNYLCLPVWAEFEPGVFTRLVDRPAYPPAGSQ